MATKRFPQPPAPPNQADMWQDAENDPYQDIVSRRGYDANAMREFPAPYATDPGLSGEGDDLPGLQEPGTMSGVPVIEDVNMTMYGKRSMMLPDPEAMLKGLRGENVAADPRIDAIEQLSRQGQVQRPGMKTEQDLQGFEQQYGMPSESNRLANPRKNLMQGLDDGRGSPNDQQDAADAAQMSDEDLLGQIQKQMNRPMDAQGKDPMPPDVPDPPDMWPATPEEFKQKYGRAPATDMEVEHYYGDPQDDYPNMDEPTNERDMRSGRP